MADKIVKKDVLGRSKTWKLQFHRTKNYEGPYYLEYVESISKELFVKYKIYVQKILLNSNPELDYLDYINSYLVVGLTNKRKRISTLENALSKLSELYYQQFPEQLPSTKDHIYVQNISQPFEKVEIFGPFISSSDVSSEYKGEDVEQLDIVESRYLWQEELLSFFYDEEKENFIKPDDRSIYWIYDSHGATGKSKFVKWVCMNRPDEVAKITFGTSNQLRSGLISAGARKYRTSPFYALFI